MVEQLSTLQRLMKNTVIDPETGCWNWTAAIGSHGYGVMAMIVVPFRKSVIKLAHRVAYELLNGPFPKDRPYADHLCRNRRCVNFKHIEPVTHQENVARGQAGKILRERAANITHCPKGHEYTEENTYLKRQGRDGKYHHRGCRECHRLRILERRYRLNGKKPTPQAARRLREWQALRRTSTN